MKNRSDQNNVGIVGGPFVNSAPEVLHLNP
jgi:hypothetical protein